MSRASIQADAYLLLATAAWGITFPLIKEAMQFIPPDVFVTLRFGLASLILCPFLIRALAKSDWRTFYFGIILGAINSAIYLTQAQGMETIDPAQGAFITGINVVFVPVFLWIFGIGKPTRKDFYCSFVCFSGVFVLTGAGFTTLHIGVFWIMSGAVFVALSIVFLQKYSAQTSHLDALAFIQILTTVSLVFPWTLEDSYAEALNLSTLLSIGFCAVFATSFALLIQTRYQRLTNPSRAALIFALEPVFATFFTYSIQGSAPNWRTLIGGSLILLSIGLSEFLSAKHRKKMNRVNA